MDFSNEKLYLLMQVNDSVFPIGGYTQSYGLETYILQKKIQNAQDAYDYIAANLRGSYLYTEMLAASLAFDYAKAGDQSKITELDQILRVTKSPLEIRDASEKLGNRFVKTIATTDITFESNMFKDYAARVERGDQIPNHSVAFGVFAASIGADKDSALTFFMYAATSAMVTNSVKAVPLSQTNGQQILYKCHKVFDELLAKIKNLSEDDLGLSMPGLDIKCMQHETLYSRLYMS